MLTFYHAPYSRSSATLWLLQELGVGYELQVVDIRNPASLYEEYRQIQPNMKVPAVTIDDLVLTERAAIATYLADRFPKRGLAPAPDDPMRAPYLTMMVYCDSVLDPCVTARAQGWDYKGSDFSFGSFDDMVAYLDRVLTSRPYAAGDRFTAADTQLSSALQYASENLEILPQLPSFQDYIARTQTRPAARQVGEIDMEISKAIQHYQSGTFTG